MTSALKVADCSDADAAAVNQVVKWVLTGSNSFDIAEAIRTNYPDADELALMRAAMDHLERAGNFDPTVVRGWCFEATRDLYRRMTDVGDYAGALRAIKQISELARNVHHRPDEEKQDEEAGEDTQAKVVQP